MRQRRLPRLAALGAGGALLAGTAMVATPAWSADPPVIDEAPLSSIAVDTHAMSFTITTSTTATWVATDDQGRTVASGDLAAGATPITLENLAMGQYLLRVEDSNGLVDSSPFAVVTTFTGERDVRFAMNTKFGLPADGQAPRWDPESETYDPVGTPRYTQDLMPILELTGAGATRDTIAWNQFEPETARYAGGPHWYEDFIDANAEMGAPTTVILSYGNNLYDIDEEGFGAAPHTDEGIAAYAAYAREVLSRYEGRVDTVEVWNEYNAAEAPWNRGPCAGDARCYYEMLKATHEAVAEVHPEAQIVGPAAVTLPYGWLDELFSYGALDYLDAVTVHPYGFPAAPETGYSHPSFDEAGIEARVEQLDELIREHNDGEQVPIWFTEIGWGSYEAPRGVSESVQADYMVRTHVMALSAGVERMYWYSLRNDRSIPAGPGANWGLVRNEGDPLGSYAPKESFTAYTTMTRLLSGAESSGRQDAPEGVRDYLFEQADGTEIDVLWSPEGHRDVTLRTDAPVTVTRQDGESRTLFPDDGRVYLSISTDPVYVDGGIDAVEDGSRITASGPASAPAAENATITVTVDGSDEQQATPALVDVEGEVLDVTTPPNQERAAESSVPVGPGVETSPHEGQEQIYTRTVLVEVELRDRLSGWLSTEVRVS
ncbi:glycosyl hydrolase [Ruania alba]|uniref:Glycosyl hydrolase catalytic core n=1 Tax=Ruania alba TaxID=648782 RepID=A0A1H5K9J4_9MICO|nr:glycosyl hydrolase [Ruania alba]SEE61475.1 Glycosyl hydrolase catalytic core [Ruania alba]